MRFWNYKVCLIEDFTLYFIAVESSSLSRSHSSHTEIYCIRKHLRFTFRSMPFQNNKKLRNSFFYIFLHLYFFLLLLSAISGERARVCVSGCCYFVFCFRHCFHYTQFSSLTMLFPSSRLVSLTISMFHFSVDRQQLLSLHWEVEWTERTTYQGVHSRQSANVCLHLIWRFINLPSHIALTQLSASKHWGHMNNKKKRRRRNTIFYVFYVFLPNIQSNGNNEKKNVCEKWMFSVQCFSSSHSLIIIIIIMVNS